MYKCLICGKEIDSTDHRCDPPKTITTDNTGGEVMDIQEIINRMENATNDELNLSLIKELKQALSKKDTGILDCKWWDEDDGCFETSCGKSFQFNNGGIKDNLFMNCPFCGGSIKQTT